MARSDEILQAGAPPFDALQATLIAAEALTSAGRLPEAEQRLAAAADALDPKVAPAAWGEYLRLRGGLYAKGGSAADAYHNFAQSATLLDLLGERYQAALSHLALGRLVAQTGARSVAERHLNMALGVFEQLGAARDSSDAQEARGLLTSVGSGEYVISPADADDAIVRRIVDAAALPDLLGRETAAAMIEAAAGDCAVVFVNLPGRRRPRGGVGRRRRGHGARHGEDGVQRPQLRPRHADRRTARPRPRGPAIRAGRRAAPARASGAAPAPHDRHRGAPGLRACARRATGRRGPPWPRSIDRSNPCCPDS